jgi:hypothetical protein
MIALLFGCNGPKPAETIYEHLEKAVSLEAGFEEAQEPLVAAEESEQELYHQIMKLSMSEFEKIKSLSEEALKLAAERKSLLLVEKESIQASYTEFERIEPLVIELKEEELKKSADSLYKAMEARRSSYETLHDDYLEAIQLDVELYELFQKEELTIDELKAHIEKLNTQYEKVMMAKDDFNLKTDEYNESKELFYEKADLNISFE